MVSKGDSPVTISPALRGLIEALHGTDVVADEDWVEFPVADLYVIANIVEVADRVRVRVYLPTDTEQLVKDWVAQQPAPRSGLLEASGIEDDDWRPRLVFERPIADHDWSADPLMDEVDDYRAAWHDDSSVAPRSQTRPSYVIRDDPRDVAPASAWLLKGSEASFPTPEELRAAKVAADVGIFEWHWTTAAQTQIGDLVLFYFLHPRKAVHFVARAASDAYFSKDLPVNADGHVNQAQWWGYFTTPIEIEPIPVDALREAVGYLPLRGRSGLFLRPDSIGALQIRAADPSRQAELERVVKVPVGLADLPDPTDITHAVWRELAAGALPLEAYVSTHIVEPLLRDALEGSGLSWTREYPIGRRWADFVILDGETPVHVIEVKKVLKKGPLAGWAESRDFKQLRWYADRLGTPGTLIDSHRVLLVERGGDQPIHEIARRLSTKADLKKIQQHIATL